MRRGAADAACGIREDETMIYVRVAANHRRDISEHVLAAAAGEADRTGCSGRVAATQQAALRKQKRLPKQPFNGWRLGGSNPVPTSRQHLEARGLAVVVTG